MEAFGPGSLFYALAHVEAVKAAEVPRVAMDVRGWGAGTGAASLPAPRGYRCARWSSYIACSSQLLLRVPAVVKWLDSHVAECAARSVLGSAASSTCVACALRESRELLGRVGYPALVSSRGLVGGVFADARAHSAVDFLQELVGAARCAELAAGRAVAWQVRAGRPVERRCRGLRPRPGAVRARTSGNATTAPADCRLCFCRRKSDLSSPCERAPLAAPPSFRTRWISPS